MLYPRTLLSAKQLAQYFQVSRALVSKWTKEGAPCTYIGTVKEPRRGSRPRYDIAQVETWLKSRAKDIVERDSQRKHGNAMRKNNAPNIEENMERLRSNRLQTTASKIRAKMMRSRKQTKLVQKGDKI